MPYPNEHSCSFLSKEVIQCRRTTRISDNRKYGVITCEYTAPVSGGKSKWAEQAFRYPIDKWTPEQARSHCARHKGKFEAAKKPVTKQDLPEGRLVRKQTIIKVEGGIFIKD